MSYTNSFIYEFVIFIHWFRCLCNHIIIFNICTHIFNNICNSMCFWIYFSIWCFNKSIFIYISK